MLILNMSNSIYSIVQLFIIHNFFLKLELSANFYIFSFDKNIW